MMLVRRQKVVMLIMNEMVSLFFERRGYTPDFLRSIENGQHGLLLDADLLCIRLREIHDAGDKIVVLPDFDMDGIASGVVGTAGLAELGFNVSLYAPSTNAYGFRPSDIDVIVKKDPDVKAIITCDVGSSCFDALSYAKSLGLKVFVTDHHTVISENLGVDAFVNPLRPSDTYAHKAICGAHVLYQCLQHYADLYCDNNTRDRISMLRVFAGIGTVSDSMPVLYENRVLIRDAISICRYIFAEGSDFVMNRLPGCDIYKRAFWGLYDILASFQEEGRISCPDNIDEDFFGYYLAPTFNSVKRMGEDITIAFGAFFGDDREFCISELLRLNEERKELVKTHLDLVLSMEQPFAPFVYHSTAPSGILGLLSMKLMLLTGMPNVVLREDVEEGTGNMYLHGSGRSPEWYSFLSRVTEDGPTGVTVQGHQLAFGVRTNALIEPLLFAFLKSDVDDLILSGQLSSGTKYDAVISMLGDGDFGLDISLFFDFAKAMENLRPFGTGFPEPQLLFKFKGKDVIFDTIGSNKQHLRVSAPFGFRALCWNQAENLPTPINGDAVYAVSGSLSCSTYHGNESVSFIGDFLGEMR